MIINAIKKDEQDQKVVKEIIDLVIDTGGISYAEQKMHEYKDLAINELKNIPESPSKEAFLGLIEYSIYRTK